jgi:hypothetical protein
LKILPNILYLHFGEGRIFFFFFNIKKIFYLIRGRKSNKILHHILHEENRNVEIEIREELLENLVSHSASNVVIQECADKL